MLTPKDIPDMLRMYDDMTEDMHRNWDIEYKCWGFLSGLMFVIPWEVEDYRKQLGWTDES